MKLCDCCYANIESTGGSAREAEDRTGGAADMQERHS